ncbi:hypothetical protein TNIN_237891 [Trichonephila inaurata madagascariensis]|uniref:Uncharacterized protein n=1 Tax=Trichonephila inaurata madagascariensis TaxID=2747483 RepID=A0A8X7CCI2_9ARAC|nr:hypothetical protein TNIN_237891 [Trichonephila inaurata madagascariensis]
MDPGNTNTIPDYPDLRTELRLKIRSAEAITEQGEILLNLQERLYSLLNSDFNEIVSHCPLLEGSQTERIKAAFHETEMLVTQVKEIVKSGKKIQDVAKKKLELISLHVSEHDRQNEVTEIKDLLTEFVKMSSLIYESTAHFQRIIYGH